MARPGALPSFFAVLLPMAVLAGAALAIANARVDLDADRAAGHGVGRVAPRRASVHGGSTPALWAVAVVLAVAWLVAVAAPRSRVSPRSLAWPSSSLGVGRSGAGTGRSPARWAWELEASSASTALVAWLVAGPLTSMKPAPGAGFRAW